MAALTPRQKEIKALIDQGKTPTEIAKKLKISRNAVYQQKRRIETGGSRRTSNSGRSSRRSAPRIERVKVAPEPLAPVAADPLAATRERIGSVKLELREAEHAKAAAEKALVDLTAEVHRLEAAEAALTGKTPKTTTGPSRSRSSRQRPAQAASDGGQSAPENGKATPSVVDTVAGPVGGERTEAQAADA